jgi:hypothetical protein
MSSPGDIYRYLLIFENAKVTTLLHLYGLPETSRRQTPTRRLIGESPGCRAKPVAIRSPKVWGKKRGEGQALS